MMLKSYSICDECWVWNRNEQNYLWL